jgi:hypothetical protein
MAGNGAGGSGQAGSGSGGTGLGGAGGSGASVLQHHKNPWRDGLYVDPIFTKAAASKVHMDTTFKSTIQGPTLAQPLYFENGPAGKDVIIAVTEQNQVYALDSANGSVVWQKQVGTPVGAGNLPCGNIMPVLGITGTPVIDAPSRTLFFDAMTTPDGGSTKKRLIFALSLDDGSTRAGWPVDVSAVAKAGAVSFDSSVQSQRAALALVGGTVYVGYGGHWGDCGNYHGWVVGVPITNPSGVKAFATAARGAGIWGPGGIASDGTSLFVSTGNSMGTNGTWGQGEAILRLSAGPTFSGQTADYFAPSNWKPLDDMDMDLGGSGPVLVDVPGANPSHLVVALGKNGVAYLINRANLGGIGTGNGTTGEAVASMKIASNQIIQAAAAYTTSQGTYVAFNGVGMCAGGGFNDLSAIKISATTPPAISMGWCSAQGGFGSPIATTTDGRSEAVVWSIGGGHLIAFDGDTGAKLMPAGSNANDGMSEVANRQTPIVAKGRIFVAANNNVYAFKPQ